MGKRRHEFLAAFRELLRIAVQRIVPATVQDRECRIFLEAWVREAEPALVKNRASIGANEAHMATVFTQPDFFWRVSRHDCQLNASAVVFRAR